MRRNDNRIIVDLNKVQFARKYYSCNSFGIIHNREFEPDEPTVNGCEFDCDVPRAAGNPETMYEFAKRKGLLDVWTPTLRLQLSSNHSLVYTGDKALELHKAWCAKIFGKKGKK